MGVAGLGKLAGLDMLVELGLELVGVAALELAGLGLAAALERAELELVGPAGLVGVAALELAELELVGPAGLVGFAVLESPEPVGFAALGPGLAGLCDPPEPAPLRLAQLALGNGAEHYSKWPSSAKEASELGQSPGLSLSAPYAHETMPLPTHSPPEAVEHCSAPSCQRSGQSASAPPPAYTAVACPATRS